MRKYRGVGRVGHKWRAVVQVKGKPHHIGYFDTEEDAHNARVEYMRKIGRFDTIVDLEGEEWRISPLLGEPIWVSNKGRIKTMDFDRMGFTKLYKFRKAWHERYYTVCIQKEVYMVHRIVADAFIGQSDLDVNHIDNDSFNNCVENLEYVTNRENTSHAFGGATGIVFVKSKQMWRATIRYKGKRFTLGYSKDPDIAHQLYLNGLEKLGERNKYAISPSEKYS